MDPAQSEARNWLDEHANLERGDRWSRDQHPVPAQPNIDRIRRLVDLLGGPQTAYPVIHLTGTNGKSSTARMTAALLAARGLSVGLYTSPHLARVNERLEWNGRPIDDDTLDSVLDEVRGIEDHLDSRPTYFEILTAAAFSWFADAAVDAAVIEVGLGGTWDATNVADATVAVVTNVGIDHVEYLGPTRYGIAKEKAGIVKDGCVLVLGETDPELIPLFTAHARPEITYRRHVDFGVRSSVMAHEGRVATLYAPAGEHEDVFLPLHGRHQAHNAACALTAAEAFFGGGEGLTSELIADAFGPLRIPGRLEVMGRHPLVIIDGAHNFDGARALRDALAEEFPSEARTLVVGMLREKDPQEMLEALGVLDAERLIVCAAPSPRALDPETLAAAAKNAGMPSAMIEVVDLVPEAVARAMAATPPGGQVIITGSLYTVGAAREVLTAG